VGREAAVTSGLEALADFVAQFTADGLTEATGLNAEQLEEFVETIDRGSGVSFWWTNR
jgi:predicted molibdopterin-dependent oxidoreductase YjgC